MDTDLNVKHKTIKLQKKTGENLGNFGYGDAFLDITPDIIHEKKNN